MPSKPYLNKIRMSGNRRNRRDSENESVRIYHTLPSQILGVNNINNIFIPSNRQIHNIKHHIKWS